MKFNKKGMQDIGLGLIIMFLILSTIFLFSTAFVYQLGDEFILNNAVDVFNTTAANLNLDSTTMATINNIQSDYNSNEPPYDIGFLILLIGFITLSIWTSYTAQQNGNLTFFGLLTFGMILFLFLYGFIELLTNWFYTNLIIGFLQFDFSTKAPLMYAFFDNSEFYAFIWAFLLILINKLGFKVNVFKKDEGGFEQ